MADDVLSAAERETLLAARAPRVVPAGCSSPLSSSAPVRLSTALPLNETLRRAVSTIGDECARRSAPELSALLRRTVRVELTAVTQVTYRDFAARLATPTCFNLFSAPPLEGPWMLEIGLAILYPAIDCMLGGGRATATIESRPLTDIELRLAGRVTNLWMRQLQAAWRPAGEIECSLDGVASSPNASAIFQPSEPIVWMRFDVEWAGTRGPLNLGIPTRSLAGIAGNLNSPLAEHPDAAISDSAEATVELVARLAQSKIAPEDVLHLSLGDVITTDQPSDAPIAVFQDGVLKFRASTGSLDGRKAVEIEDLASEFQQNSPAES